MNHGKRSKNGSENKRENNQKWEEQQKMQICRIPSALTEKKTAAAEHRHRTGEKKKHISNESLNAYKMIIWCHLWPARPTKFIATYAQDYRAYLRMLWISVMAERAFLCSHSVCEFIFDHQTLTTVAPAATIID